MKIITFITGSFGSVFGGIWKVASGFFDKATKFDENETIMVAKELSKVAVSYKRNRYGTEIIFKYPKKGECMPIDQSRGL